MASPKPFLRKSAQSFSSTYIALGNFDEDTAINTSPKEAPKLFDFKRILFLLASLSLLIFLIIDTPVKKKLRSCTKGVEGRPLLQYALMIDAGSTGSRIHIYRFNYCDGLSPTVEDEVFEQLKPGLSSYANDPVAAAQSLKPLLDLAIKKVPANLRKCTPIAVKATAGLRLLGLTQSNAILNEVEKFLKIYDFPITSKDGVVVMDGKDEGVYAWITVNFLTRKIGQLEKYPTVAIMDLGGASTQIVFEPNEANSIETAGDFRYAISFGKHRYVLYQHSYLGYGLMQGRLKVKTAALDNNNVLPCMSKEKSQTIEIDNGSVTLHGEDASDLFYSCKSFISSHLFSKTQPCPVSSCSFDGIHQPDITKTFPNVDGRDVYAFSYFYDRTNPLGLQNKFPISKIKALGESVCNGEKDSEQEVKENIDFCLDLSFIYNLLAVGYEIPESRELVAAKKIDGYETGWCLGAAIQMLDIFWKEGHGYCLA